MHAHDAGSWPATDGAASGACGHKRGLERAEAHGPAALRKRTRSEPLLSPAADALLSPAAETLLSPAAQTLVSPAAETLLTPEANLLLSPEADVLLPALAGGRAFAGAGSAAAQLSAFAVVPAGNAAISPALSCANGALRYLQCACALSIRPLHKVCGRLQGASPACGPDLLITVCHSAGALAPCADAEQARWQAAGAPACAARAPAPAERRPPRANAPPTGPPAGRLMPFSVLKARPYLSHSKH